MSRRLTANGHRHAEAFCLMIYAPAQPTRGVPPEVIWNSRDGVTPFILRSRCDRAELRHAFFAADRYAPRFAHEGLKVGDRIFVDLTRDRAIEHANRVVDHCDEPAHTRAAAVERLANDFLQQPGAPDIVVVDAAMLAALRAA